MEEIKKTIVKPTYDAVLVKRDKPKEVSKGGILLPEICKEQDKPVEGTVLAVGPGLLLKNGELRPMSVKVGDKILFGKYTGVEVKIDGEELIIMQEDNIFAVID